MICSSFSLKKYDWQVYSFFAVTHYDVEAIMEALWNVGCDGHNAKRAFNNLSSGSINNGLTYSNPNSRQSVIVIGLSSDASEFCNSFVHEISHLCRHISRHIGMDPNGEEVCYLSGNIAQEMFRACHHLLCDRCR